MKRTRVVAGLLCALVAAAVLAAPVLKAGSEPLNYVDINKIKGEGLQRSQVMDLASWLTDVYAPRLTGSPMSQKAAEWTVAKLKEFGLVNVKIEPWANRNGFERGWTNDKFYLAAVAPEKFPIPGTPTAWTPGTDGLVSGEVVMVTATTEADLAAYKGKLQGKWVLTQAPPDVAAYWKAPATRYTKEELDALEAWPAPQPEFGAVPPGGRAGGPGAPAPGAPPAAGRGGMGSMAARNAFFKAEGALGTFTTAPRGHGIYTVGGNRAADPATTLPAIAIGAEYYGRIARMLAKNIPVTIEANIANTFHPNPPVFNIVGELPGTDKADEIVMLGGHFDTWHAATGATDNSVGVAVMMEAMRILKTSGVKLRRTVRIGLWGGEEQGLLGSREYVAAAFRQPPAGASRACGGSASGAAGPGRSSGRPWRLRPTGPARVEAGLGQVLRLLQHRQRHGRPPGHLPPGQRRRGADLPRVDGAVPQPRHDDDDHPQHGRHRSPGLRCGRPARLPVHPGRGGVRHDDAPHEPGLLRAAAAGRHAEDGHHRRRLRVLRGEPRREAAAQAAHGAGRRADARK